MRKYLKQYIDFLLEKEESSKKEDSEESNDDKPKKKRNVSPDVAKRIAKKSFKEGGKNLGNLTDTVKNKKGEEVIVPKDIQLKKLAQELYKAQYDVATFKYILADKIAQMKKDGADEGTIEKAEEMGADQMANVQLRSDAINAQMIAAAGENTKLSLKADELAQGAINAALKAAQEFYQKRAEKWLKDTKKQKAEKEKEKDSDEKEAKNSDKKSE